MRGNRAARHGRGYRQGSIPAHAGEPSSRSSTIPWLRVYPRACGGTRCTTTGTWKAAGLSPRMRGNLPHTADPHDASGSIPAHAGEPRAVPRGVGFLLGLSPRMRGNLTAVESKIDDLGSIPAHAGEPSQQPPSSFCSGVYPRACGGTFPTAAIVLLQWGLSPRMRGNLVKAV